MIEIQDDDDFERTLAQIDLENLDKLEQQRQQPAKKPKLSEVEDETDGRGQLFTNFRGQKFSSEIFIYSVKCVMIHSAKIRKNLGLLLPF